MPIYYDDLSLSGKELLRFILAITAAGMTVGWLFYDSLVLGCVISGLLYGALPLYKKRLTEGKKAMLLTQFRDLLYSISSSVYAGRSMAKALGEAQEFCAGTYDGDDFIMMELDYMNRLIENGRAKDTEVLTDFAVRSTLEDIADFANVYESCKSSGGDMVKSISRAITIIGDKIGIEQELKTLMVQKQFEGRIVGLSPVVIVGFLRLTSEDYFAPMTQTGAGRVLTTVAIGLIGLGMLMIERLSKVDV